MPADDKKRCLFGQGTSARPSGSSPQFYASPPCIFKGTNGSGGLGTPHVPAPMFAINEVAMSYRPSSESRRLEATAIGPAMERCASAPLPTATGRGDQARERMRSARSGYGDASERQQERGRQGYGTILWNVFEVSH
jgi:hypothetical protein